MGDSVGVGVVWRNNVTTVKTSTQKPNRTNGRDLLETRQPSVYSLRGAFDFGAISFGLRTGVYSSLGGILA